MTDVEVPNAPVLSDGAMDVTTALQKVLKTAHIYGYLIHSLHEAAKALEKRKAVLGVLTEHCDERNEFRHSAKNIIFH
ncbi:unnamed protein product [Pieris macdunnoughi]|uniref:Ribosomal protein eL8/eL30/eS12/Gadd45 domain-containing protein n=1 Tax=Pieris macdunnoughi TaxID=345717 RepID=A0A821X5J5_9NEOP|nr:unnamed protein product [Pieris macdunnoughi]